MNISNQTTKSLDYSAAVFATFLTTVMLLGVVGCKHAHAEEILSKQVRGNWIPYNANSKLQKEGDENPALVAIQPWKDKVQVDFDRTKFRLFCMVHKTRVQNRYDGFCTGTENDNHERIDEITIFLTPLPDGFLNIQLNEGDELVVNEVFARVSSECMTNCER